MKKYIFLVLLFLFVFSGSVVFGKSFADFPALPENVPFTLRSVGSTVYGEYYVLFEMPYNYKIMSDSLVEPLELVSRSVQYRLLVSPFPLTYYENKNFSYSWELSDLRYFKPSDDDINKLSNWYMRVFNLEDGVWQPDTYIGSSNYWERGPKFNHFARQNVDWLSNGWSWLDLENNIFVDLDFIANHDVKCNGTDDVFFSPQTEVEKALKTLPNLVGGKALTVLRTCLTVFGLLLGVGLAKRLICWFLR